MKHYHQTRAFLHLREDRQTVPDTRKRDNADCATESPAKPAELVLRTGSTAHRRPREVGSVFRSSCLNRYKPRRSPHFSAARPRVPRIQRSAPVKKRQSKTKTESRPETPPRPDQCKKHRISFIPRRALKNLLPSSPFLLILHRDCDKIGQKHRAGSRFRGFPPF